MNRETEASGNAVHPEGSLLVLALLSLLVGAASGAIGAAFRLALTRVDQLRDGFLAWSHGETIVGLPLLPPMYDSLSAPS